MTGTATSSNNHARESRNPTSRISGGQKPGLNFGAKGSDGASADGRVDRVSTRVAGEQISSIDIPAAADPEQVHPLDQDYNELISNNLPTNFC